MVRAVALTFGVVFLLVGALGFVPAALSAPPAGGSGGHDLHVRAFEGYLIGLFHVNALHSAVHLLFGVLGLVMGRTYRGGRSYLRFVAVAYALLAVMGLIPMLNTVFGLIPIHGNDVWLHAVLAVAAGAVGFTAPAVERGRATTVVA